MADGTREPTPPLVPGRRRRNSKPWDWDPTAPMSIASEMLRAAARIEDMEDEDVTIAAGSNPRSSRANAIAAPTLSLP